MTPAVNVTSESPLCVSDHDAAVGAVRRPGGVTMLHRETKPLAIHSEHEVTNHFGRLRKCTMVRLWGGVLRSAVSRL
jgi:hypothetical protein